MVTAGVVVAAVVVTQLGSSGGAVPAAADPGTRPVARDVAATSSVPSADRTPTTADSAAASGATPCRPWRIVVAPELAAVIRDLVPDLSCDAVEVQAQDPADVVAGVAGNTATPADVWIPDSSWWLQRAEQQGLPTPVSSTSVASSPIVLGLAEPTARTLAAASGSPLTVTSVLRSRTSATPVRVGLPDPRRSAAAVGLLLALESAVSGSPDAKASLTWGLRSSPAGLEPAAAGLVERLGQDPDTAVPVSEQAVLEHNRQPGAAAVTSIFPTSAGTTLDYPLTVLDPAASAGADELRRALAGATGRDLLAQHGFRGPDGATLAAADPTAADPASADPAVGYHPLPAGPVIDALLSDFDLSNKPSRLLGVLDVSGSMNAVVPGTGGATRISLATQAAARGVGLYPADSELGLWVFSRNLTPTTDYRELAPVAPLGTSVDGVTGQQRLIALLAGVTAIPDGDTGLYDTTLAAVREMRAHWDPARINSVLILSDGKNDDAKSITLTELLATLTAEADPARPVAVISIAFGPDSDVDALAQISAATGGPSYVAHDPRDVGEIFLDSVGQRICRPSCPSGS